jgi:hypothetical protein
MADRDEHAAYEWAEFNLPLEVRALPPQPSPLARRVISRLSLATARPEAGAQVGEYQADDPFWLWRGRPA